jgi:hypothetical protein
MPGLRLSIKQPKSRGIDGFGRPQVERGCDVVLHGAPQSGRGRTIGDQVKPSSTGDSVGRA